MNKNIIILSLISSIMMCSGCESEHQSDNTYKLACLASGGQFKNEQCYCGNLEDSKACAAGILCRDNKCAEQSACEQSGGTIGTDDSGVDHCFCAGTECSPGIVCNSITKQCAEQPACEASGGISNKENNRCNCGGTTCDDGVLCNTVTKQCANKLEGTCMDINKVVCNSGYMMTCGEDHQWTAQKCEGNFGCNDDSTECAECDRGKCIDNSYMECVGRMYKPQVTCEHGCSESGCLPACSGTEAKCFDSRLHSCDNGKWKEEKICEYGCHSNGIECNQNCTDGATRCLNGQLLTCIGGEYANPVACTNNNSPVSCLDESRCGECQDNAEKADCKDGIVSRCSKGQWVETKCNNSVSCTKDLKCGVCQNEDSKECFNGKAIKCIDGQWSAEKVVCNQEIEVGCTSDSKCAICVEGDTKECTNGEAIQCIDGQWSAEKVVCNQEIKVGCTSEAKCAVCVEGDTKECTNGKAIKCIDGQWSAEKVVCNEETEVSCTADGRCGECKDDTVSCSNDTDEVGKFIKCIDGTWSSEPEPCPGNASCDTSNTDSTLVQCGQCYNKESDFCVEVSGMMYKYKNCINGNPNGIRTPCPTGICNEQKCQ